MEIVLSTLELGAVGGAATYLMTVSEQLQSLGHEVTLYAGEAGELARGAQERGLRVVSSEDALPERCDAVYAQDTATAYLLAECYRGRPQALCMHAETFNRWLPPQLSGVVGATVVLHERMVRRAAALAHREEVVRLRQPVDLDRFAPRSAIGDRARRVLLLGNYLSGTRRELVVSACQEAGLECLEVGRYGARTSLTPEAEINQVDIVIGHGRSIVEAMACGRAAFVYDHAGGDGWVTPESYAALEACNFAFPTSDHIMTPERLSRRLAEYRPAMGTANRDLACRHHGAARHAQQLVALFERLSPVGPAADAPLRELARMVRAQWQSESRALGAAHDARLLSARAQAAEAGRAEAEARLAELQATRRYRLACGLARPLDRLRAAARSHVWWSA